MENPDIMVKTMQDYSKYLKPGHLDEKLVSIENQSSLASPTTFYDRNICTGSIPKGWMWIRAGTWHVCYTQYSTQQNKKICISLLEYMTVLGMLIPPVCRRMLQHDIHMLSWPHSTFSTAKKKDVFRRIRK